MIQKQILRELAENQKKSQLAGIVFGASSDKNEIKEGKPIKEIISEMRKASNEKLFRVTDNVSFL